MKKTIVVTLGYSEWPVVSSLLKHGLEKGDKITAVVPSKTDARSQSAINEIKNFLSKFATDVELEIFSVNVHDFDKAVSQLMKFIRKEKEEGRNLYVNLSGGMRVLILEVFTALILSGVTDLVAELVTEDKSEVVFPSLWSLNLFSYLDRLDFQILSLASNEQNIIAIAKAVRKPVSTVYRRVVAMEKNGLVRTVKKDRMRKVVLTPLGRIISDSHVS
ncbi:MAG: CRISPR-associated CARF protein Csa3 [Candidatus Caldarchaeum sp.]|uniref:CRISPR locus-related DNA-binding protein n=1 Tax=Caldiarchaeum subterraneum TaxID=311458 RepID=A0A7C5Y8N6_CALS0